MKNLKLRIKSIEANGAVVLVPVVVNEFYNVEKGTDKVLTAKDEKKLKPEAIERKTKQVHPISRLHFIPMADDKTAYKVDDVYEVTLTKVK